MSPPRKTWLALKDEYLTLQKRSMTSLKKCMNKMDQREQDVMETDGGAAGGGGEFVPSHPSSACSEEWRLTVAFCLPEEKSNRCEKVSSQGPQFTSGVIVKITDNKPLPERKFIKVGSSFMSLGFGHQVIKVLAAREIPVLTDRSAQVPVCSADAEDIDSENEAI